MPLPAKPLKTRCGACKKRVPRSPLRRKSYMFWYMLEDKVWDQATNTTDGLGHICLRCVRQLLQRNLTEEDFSRRSMCNWNYGTRPYTWLGPSLAAYANGDDRALDGTRHYLWRI